MLVSNKIRIKLTLVQIMRVLALLIFIVIGVQAIFFTNNFFGSKIGLSAFNIVIGSVMLIAVLCLLVSWLKRLSLKKQRAVLWILMCMWLLLQLFFDFYVQGAQGVDDLDVRLQAHKLAAGDINWSGYFHVWPNNVNIAIFFSWIIRFFRLIGITDTWLLFNLFITLITFVTLVMGTKILDNIVSFEAKIVLWTFILFYAPFYVVNFYSYTDPIAAFFVVLSFWELSKLGAHNKWDLIHLLCGIILIVCGTLIKTNAVIFVITIPIFIFFKYGWKKLAQSLLILIIVMGLGIFFQNKIQSQYEYSENSEVKFPTEYWIALSYNKYSKGTVKSNQYTWSYTGRVKGVKNKVKVDRKLIKDEIRSLGLSGVLKQYLDKTNVMYSSGNAGIIMRDFSIYPKYSKITTYLSGTNGNLMSYLAQIVYTVAIILVAFQIGYMFLRRMPVTLFDMFLIFFIGLYMFHILLWEVENRYLYLILPLIFVFAAYSFLSNNLENEITVLVGHSSRGKWLITALIMTIIGTFLIGNYSLIEFKNSNYVAIQQQTFFRTDSIKLKPQESIEQTFKLSVAPKYLKLNLGSKYDHFHTTLIDLKTHKSILLGQQNGYYKLKANSGNILIKVTNKSNHKQDLSVNKSKDMKLAQSMIKVKDVQQKKYSGLYLNEGFYRDGSYPFSKKIYWFGAFLLIILVAIVLAVVWRV